MPHALSCCCSVIVYGIELIHSEMQIHYIAKLLIGNIICKQQTLLEVATLYTALTGILQIRGPPKYLPM